MKNLLKDLNDYGAYLRQHPFHEMLDIKNTNFTNLDIKNDSHKVKNYSPGDLQNTPYPVELDDLIRLHFLVTNRKVSTVLEFGIGNSTIVLDHALETNKKKFGEFYKKNLRGDNLFECHTVDDDKYWFEKSQNNNTKNIKYHFSECRISTFNDRVCTFYDKIPNICPDLIYLDGPDQFSPSGGIRGISMNHKDRLPMSADILAIEHFLLPGTLIVSDGRSANIRFLISNFQRSWTHTYNESADQHYLELTEMPLGRFNKQKIEFCLDDDFYKRLNASLNK